MRVHMLCMYFLNKIHFIETLCHPVADDIPKGPCTQIAIHRLQSTYITGTALRRKYVLFGNMDPYLTGPKPKEIKVETFRIDYLTQKLKS